MSYPEDFKTKVERARLDRPDRFCNGGPTGKAWCGKPATHVANNNGFCWFCCPEHNEGAGELPRTLLTQIDAWYATAREQWDAEDAANILRNMETL